MIAVDAVDVEERFLARVLADGLDRLRHGELLVEREELGVHQRAGGLLLAFEQRLELRALRRAEELEDARAALFFERVEQVRRVVGSGRVADRRQRRVIERFEDLVEIVVVEIEQRTRRFPASMSSERMRRRSSSSSSGSTGERSAGSVLSMILRSCGYAPCRSSFVRSCWYERALEGAPCGAGAR
jgi:hypothetical protein